MSHCNECSTKFKQNVKKIGCGICGQWFHAENCANIKKEMWDLLSKEKQLKWYCGPCNSIAPEVLETLQKCIKDNIEIKNNLADMKKEINDIREGKDVMLDETIKKTAKEVCDENMQEETPPEETIKRIAKEVCEERNQEETPPEGLNQEAIRNIAREEVKENNDKKGREENIIISNIDEEIDANTEVQKILTHLEVTVEVQGIKCMERDKKTDRNRPI